MTRVFISYKSQNVNIARAFAEALVAEGVAVWFAEHEVLAENYDVFDADVTNQLCAAASSCTHGLVLTNNLWAESEHCRNELAALLDALPDDSRIIEICVPRENLPRKAFPVLGILQAETYQGDRQTPEPEEIVRLLRRIDQRWGLGLDQTRCARQVAHGRPLDLTLFGVSLDLGPFTPSVLGSMALQRHMPRGSSAAYLEGTVEGSSVTGHLQVTPFTSVLDSSSASWGDTIDDRELYRSYRLYAKDWYERYQESQPAAGVGPDRDLPERLVEKGLHLIFIRDQSHLGLTYTSKDLPDGGRIWERRYAISVQGELPGENGEVTLVFSAHLSGTEAEQRAAFCRLGPHLEAVAASIRYQTPRGWQALVNTLPRAMALGAWTAAAVAGAVHLATTGGPSWVITLLAGLSGVLLGDLGQMLADRLYRRFIWLYQPLSDDLLSRDLYTRLSSGLLHGLISAPVGALGGAAWALVRPRGPVQVILVVLLAAVTGLLSIPALRIPLPADPGGLLLPAVSALVLGVVTTSLGISQLRRSLEDRSSSQRGAGAGEGQEGPCA